MAEGKDATSVPLSQAVEEEDPEIPVKSSPSSSNSSTRQVLFCLLFLYLFFRVCRCYCLLKCLLFSPFIQLLLWFWEFLIGVSLIPVWFCSNLGTKNLKFLERNFGYDLEPFSGVWQSVNRCIWDSVSICILLLSSQYYEQLTRVNKERILYFNGHFQWILLKKLISHEVFCF